MNANWGEIKLCKTKGIMSSVFEKGTIRETEKKNDMISLVGSRALK